MEERDLRDIVNDVLDGEVSLLERIQSKLFSMKVMETERDQQLFDNVTDEFHELQISIKKSKELFIRIADMAENNSRKNIVL